MRASIGIHRLTALSVAAVALLACELPVTQVPAQQSFVLLHGVLNATDTNQQVLLERTLAGDKFVTFNKFDPDRPIVSTGGFAISFATALLISETADTVVAHEDTTAVYRTGVYLFSTPLGSLVPGAQYLLRVRTPQGEELTASTRVPAAGGTPLRMPRSFNRDGDTVRVEWAPVEHARAYAVRIEGPYGPHIWFTDSTHVRLTGSLRNVSVGGLPRSFLPGFRHVVTVSAVDTNFYDYYRTSNNSATGTGLISRIQGGLGLFGAITPLVMQRFDVTATASAAIDGTYDQIGTAPYFAPTIQLFLESPAAQSGGSDALTGRYWHVTGATDAILGTMRGDSLRLRFLINQLASDTAEFLRAQVRGDTIHARFSRGATGIFVKRGT